MCGALLGGVLVFSGVVGSVSLPTSEGRWGAICDVW